MQKIRILFQPPLGNNYGFSLRSATTSIIDAEFVGSGVSDNDITAKKKALSELIERYSLNKKIKAKPITVLCRPNEQKYTLDYIFDNKTSDNSETYSSGCRLNIYDAIDDAVVEMFERYHLDMWCKYLINDAANIQTDEIIYSVIESNLTLSEYINSQKIKIYISRISHLQFIPSFILIGVLDNKHEYLLVSTSGKSIASAIQKGLLDIAKILIVNENFHKFSLGSNLIHSSQYINALWSASVKKINSCSQLTKDGNKCEINKKSFQIKYIRSDLSDSLGFHPVSITRRSMREILELDEDINLDQKDERIIRDCFS